MSKITRQFRKNIRYAVLLRLSKLYPPSIREQDKDGFIEGEVTLTGDPNEYRLKYFVYEDQYGISLHLEKLERGDVEPGEMGYIGYGGDPGAIRSILRAVKEIVDKHGVQAISCYTWIFKSFPKLKSLIERVTGVPLYIDVKLGYDEPYPPLPRAPKRQETGVLEHDFKEEDNLVDNIGGGVDAAEQTNIERIY